VRKSLFGAEVVMTRTTFPADAAESPAAPRRRLLALSEELDDLAWKAADGAAFDA
jgi:hypothetical protein